MNRLRIRLLSAFSSACTAQPSSRYFGLSSIAQAKRLKIERDEEGKTITVSGVFDDEKSKEYMDNRTVHDTVFTYHDDKPCPLCRFDLRPKYSDVLILRQFMRDDGSVLPRQYTGLCKKQQKTVEMSVMQGHLAGLYTVSPLFKNDHYGFSMYKKIWKEPKELFGKRMQILQGTWTYILRGWNRQLPENKIKHRSRLAKEFKGIRSKNTRYKLRLAT